MMEHYNNNSNYYNNNSIRGYPFDAVMALSKSYTLGIHINIKYLSQRHTRLDDKWYNQDR